MRLDGDRAGPADVAAVRVMVVDDHVFVRRGVVAYFDATPGFSTVDDASDGTHALALLRQWRTMGEPLPDVVLMDLNMPKLDGVAATDVLTREFPDISVVVLTSFGEVERVRAALSAGASGYVLKDADPDEVAAAVRAAAVGEVHLDSAVARELTRRMTAPRVGLASLTARERQILALVAKGLSNHDIAKRVAISERTARTHVSNVLSKLQVPSRTQAALLAIREGLVSPPR